MKSSWFSSLLARIGQSPNEAEEERLLHAVGVVSLLVGGTFVLLLCGLYWIFDEVLAAIGRKECERQGGDESLVCAWAKGKPHG